MALPPSGLGPAIRLARAMAVLVRRDAAPSSGNVRHPATAQEPRRIHWRLTGCHEVRRLPGLALWIDCGSRLGCVRPETTPALVPARSEHRTAPVTDEVHG